MATPLNWKIYDAAKEYQAACQEIEAAAALIGFYGEGATIRYGRTLIVWTEGNSHDGHAAQSYDHVATVAYDRALLTEKAPPK